AGIVFRDYRPTIPPEVSYGLTERGDELGDVLDGLEVIARRWGLVNETENTEADRQEAEQYRA
ncbi:MAG: winged helix-turn-helix transcriptional regulator, partial [Alphaproteobacteria bacterium]